MTVCLIAPGHLIERVAFVVELEIRFRLLFQLSKRFWKLESLTYFLRKGTKKFTRMEVPTKIIVRLWSVHR